MNDAQYFYHNDLLTDKKTGVTSYFKSLILPTFNLLSKRVINNDFNIYNLSASSSIPADVTPKISAQDTECLVGK